MSTDKTSRNSLLYRCRVGHSRLVPKVNKFSYGVYMFYLDLSELDCLSRSLPLFSYNKANLFSFYDSDHLKDFEPSSQSADSAEVLSLTDRLTAYLRENGLQAELGRVMLLTYPRIAGYVFNPVSFYFVFDKGERPLASVAEVGNTFGEMKLFYLPCVDGSFSLMTPKFFYVSPFGKLSDLFSFRVGLPGERLKISVDTLSGEDQSPVLLSAISGESLPFTSFNMFKLFCLYPLVTWKVISLIHWQAFLLWLRKVPFYMKEADRQLQKEVRNRHKSLGPKLQEHTGTLENLTLR